jgi:hypothetical protein
MGCNRLDSSGNVALWTGPGMTTIIWTVVTFSIESIENVTNRLKE